MPHSHKKDYPKILVISNLYPSPSTPSYGSFIKNFTEDLSRYNKHGKTCICVLKGRTKHNFRKILLYILFYLRILYRLIFFKYDLIYVHLITHSTIPIRIVSKFKKLNLIFNIHGEDLLVTTPLAKKLLEIAKPLLYKAKLIVVPSNYFKLKVKKTLPSITDKKILVSASGGVKPEFFKEHKDSESQITNIGYVSRIDRGKGWNIFVEAIDQLNKIGIKVKASIIGGGLEVEELKSKINSCELNHAIKYLGPIAYDKLPAYYQEMDLFVFPTLLHESLGLVGLEAMAASTPVIASNIGGITDYLEDGKNGYFFQPGNATDLVNKIEQYLNLNTAERKIMRENAYKTAHNYQSQTVSNHLFTYIFDQIL